MGIELHELGRDDLVYLGEGVIVDLANIETDLSNMRESINEFFYILIIFNLLLINDFSRFIRNIVFDVPHYLFGGICICNRDDEIFEICFEFNNILYHIEQCCVKFFTISPIVCFLNLFLIALSDDDF